jgi:hypothetical protein
MGFLTLKMGDVKLWIGKNRPLKRSSMVCCGPIRLSALLSSFEKATAVRFVLAQKSGDPTQLPYQVGGKLGKGCDVFVRGSRPAKIG